MDQSDVAKAMYCFVKLDDLIHKPKDSMCGRYPMSPCLPIVLAFPSLTYQMSLQSLVKLGTFYQF